MHRALVGKSGFLDVIHMYGHVCIDNVRDGGLVAGRRRHCGDRRCFREARVAEGRKWRHRIDASTLWPLCPNERFPLARAFCLIVQEAVACTLLVHHAMCRTGRISRKPSR